MLSPILPQLLLSLLRTAAAGLTEEQIQNAIRETSPQLLSHLVNLLKQTTDSRTILENANAIFVANDLR